MSIKIGHASIDENGHAQGGKAGDQSGKEVCIRTWYDKPWAFLLRYPDAAVAEKAAKACEAGCANANIGYDQWQRNTAHTAAQKIGYDLSKISSPVETDCSAFVTLCYLCAGVKALEYPANGNAPTTATMRAAFNKAGFRTYTDGKYLNGTEYLRRGDILVKPGSHTVMVLDDGAKVSTQKEVQKEGASTDGIQIAQSYAKDVSGAYRTTTGLNLRAGAGKEWNVLKVLKQGEAVRCWGYYNMSNSIKWLYVTTADGTAGYCSIAYLKREGA